MGIGGGRNTVKVVLEAVTRNFERGMSRASAHLDELRGRFRSSREAILETVAASREATEAVGTGGTGLVGSLSALVTVVGLLVSGFIALFKAAKAGMEFVKQRAEVEGVARAYGLAAEELINLAQAASGDTLSNVAAMQQISAGSDAALKEYARTLGKTADELTNAEAQQALLNHAQQVGADRAKELYAAGDDLAATMAELEARAEDTKTAFGAAVVEGFAPFLRALNVSTREAEAFAENLDLAKAAAQGLFGVLIPLGFFAEAFVNAIKEGKTPLEALAEGMDNYRKYLAGASDEQERATRVTSNAVGAVIDLAAAHINAYNAAEKHASGEKKVADALKKQGELGYDVFERMAELQRQAEEARREFTGGVTGKFGGLTVGETAEDKLAEIRANKTKLIFEIITEGLSLKDTLIVAAAMGLETVDAEMEAAIREAAEINARLRAGTLPGGAAAAGGAGAQLARGHTGVIPPGMIAGAPTTGLTSMPSVPTGTQHVMITIDPDSLRVGVQNALASDRAAVNEMFEERAQGGRTTVLLGGK